MLFLQFCLFVIDMMFLVIEIKYFSSVIFHIDFSISEVYYNDIVYIYMRDLLCCSFYAFIPCCCKTIVKLNTMSLSCVINNYSVDVWHTDKVVHH